MIYHVSLLLFDLSFVLYLNVFNTLELMKHVTIKDQELRFGQLHSYMSFPTIVVSWIVYIVSIILYARAFRSLKPVLLSIGLTPVLARQITKDERTPPFFTSVAFGLTVHIVLDVAYNWMSAMVELMRTQIRILNFRLRVHGFVVVFILQWRRLKLGKVLSLYFLVMWHYQVSVMSIFLLQPFQWSFLLTCTANVCNSLIKVVGLCYIIKHCVKIVLQFVHNRVRDEFTFIDDDYNRPTGLRESVGFLFVSLYTNMTWADSTRRIALLELVCFLLLSALTRSLFEVVEPYLLALNTSVVHSRNRHIGLVSFCILLLLTAIRLGFYLYGLREKVPFTIPNMITVAQIISALALYALYTIDSRRTEIWEPLDDYVYYIKGGCRTFEFVLIIIVFCYRVLDTTSKWTLFQIVMVVLHLYVNVYLPLRNGWKSIRLRRLVNQKLNALPQASAEQLEDAQDVCSICLDDLHSARVTPCNHLFHTICLRKWLNVQNKCPMCHATILYNNS